MNGLTIGRDSRSTSSPLGTAGRSGTPARTQAPGIPRYPIAREGATVLVVDGRELVRRGLSAMLGTQSTIARCLCASTPLEAFKACARFSPAIAIVGLAWVRAHPVALPQMTERFPSVQPVVLVPGGDRPRWSAITDQLVASVGERATASDLATVVQTTMTTPAESSSKPQESSHLSEREAQVLALMTEGLTNREIGATLHLSVDTVKYHTIRLYRKFGVRNRAAAVCHGARLGLCGAAD